MSTCVLSAVVDELEGRGALSARLENVSVGNAVVLVEFELVDDSPTVAGLSHRPSSATLEVDGWNGREPIELLETLADGTDRAFDDLGSDERLDRSVAVATANALSAPYVAWERGDPMALLSPSVETIVTIGLFQPAFRKFEDVEVRVVEREPLGAVSTPESVELQTYTPDETATAMDGAEVVFVTGSTLVYGGIDRYLEAAPPEATVVLVGATASLLPGPLFDAGVDVVGGAEVVDPPRVRAAIDRGECGTELHDHGVGKVYTARETPSTINLRHDSE